MTQMPRVGQAQMIIGAELEILVLIELFHACGGVRLWTAKRRTISIIIIRSRPLFGVVTMSGIRSRDPLWVCVDIVNLYLLVDRSLRIGLPLTFVSIESLHDVVILFLLFCQGILKLILILFFNFLLLFLISHFLEQLASVGVTPTSQKRLLKTLISGVIVHLRVIVICDLDKGVLIAEV